MEDTLLHGDRILVEKLGVRMGDEPKFGEVAVHMYPPNRAETFMKRIVGVPADRLRLVNKQLYRHGAALAEPYVKHLTKLSRCLPRQLSIPSLRR